MVPIAHCYKSEPLRRHPAWDKCETLLIFAEVAISALTLVRFSLKVDVTHCILRASALSRQESTYYSLRSNRFATTKGGMLIEV